MDHEFLFAATFCTLGVSHISSPPPPSTYASHYQGLSITAITGTYTISFLSMRPNLLIYLPIAMNTHGAEIISLEKTNLQPKATMRRASNQHAFSREQREQDSLKSLLFQKGNQELKDFLCAQESGCRSSSKRL